MFTLKEISTRINDIMYNGIIPVKYFKMPESNSYIPNSIISFKCVFGDEQNDYEKLPEESKKDFISSSAHVNIPIISVEKLYELYHIGLSYDYDGTIKMIKDNNKYIRVTDDNEKILFAIFVILHEFGHWNDFKSKGEKPYYYMQDMKEEKEVYDLKVKILKDKSLQNASKFKVMKELRNYFYRYNLVPCEKIANDYAISKLKDACSIFDETRNVFNIN